MVVEATKTDLKTAASLIAKHGSVRAAIAAFKKKLNLFMIQINCTCIKSPYQYNHNNFFLLLKQLQQTTPIHRIVAFIAYCKTVFGSYSLFTLFGMALLLANSWYSAAQDWTKRHDFC